MEQRKLLEFVNSSDKVLREFIERNKSLEKIKRFQINDPEVQERIMRIGIEARIFNAQTEEDFFMLAVATLQNDYVKNNTRLNHANNGNN